MADIKINIQVVEGQATAAVAGLAKQAEKADSAFKSLSLNIKQVSSATSVFLGNLASQAFTSAIASAKQFGVAVFETAIEVDNMKAKLETLTGSSQLAAQAFQTISKIADESPFELPQVGEAAEKLLALGVSVNNLEPVLRNLGDIATASGANMTELAIAFGKVEQSGILTGRELSAFQNNAIPIVDALAEVTGKTAGAVKKLANEGKIDAATFQAALQKLGQEGGFAFGAMERQSQTLEGRLKKLGDDFENLRITLGEKLGPAFKAIISTISLMVSQLVNMFKHTNAAAEASDFLVGAFNFLVQGTIILINTFQVFRLAIHEITAVIVGVLGAALDAILSPIQLIAMGIIALAETFGVSTGPMQEFVDSLDSIRKTGIGVADQIHEGAMEIAVDMTELSQKGDDLATSLESSYAREIAAAKDAETQVIDSNQKKSDKQKELTEAQITEQQKQLESRIKFDEALLAEQNRKNQIEFEAELTKDGLFDEQEKVRALQNQAALAEKQEAKALADAQELIDQDAKFQAESARQLQHLNDKKLLEAKFAADKAGRDKAIVDAEKARDKAALDTKLKNANQFFGDLASLQQSGSKRLFEIGKAAALAQAIVSGFTAINNALAVPPYPVGLALAAAAAVKSAVQIQGIQGQKFADGGIVPGNSFSGDNVVAQLNSGEMVLNKAQQSNLFNMANNGGSSGQIIEVHTTVQLDGEAVGKSVSRQVANGLQLGEVV